MSQEFALKFRILKCRIKFSTIDTSTVVAAACIAVADVGVVAVSNWQKSEGRLGVVHDDCGRGHDVAGQVVALFACRRVSPDKNKFYSISMVLAFFVASKQQHLIHFNIQILFLPRVLFIFILFDISRVCAGS